jgi:hypothetical protein
MEMMPREVAKCFWDTDAMKLDLNKDCFFIIERLLEEGDDDAIRWMMAQYDDSHIIRVVKDSRRLSPKTVGLWQNYYALPEEEIRCLKTCCQKAGWPF